MHEASGDCCLIAIGSSTRLACRYARWSNASARRAILNEMGLSRCGTSNRARAARFHSAPGASESLLHVDKADPLRDTSPPAVVARI